MRRASFFVGLVIAGTSAAWAEDPEVSPPAVVHLDDPASLAELRAANPGHYARAQKIIAAANKLCRPVTAKIQYARSDARDISCSPTLLRTSNPPKREISFRLDDTRYVALVTVTDDPPKLVPAPKP